MRVLTIIGLVVLALSLVSCAASPETPYPSPAPSPTPGDGTLHQVSIKGFAFTPQEVTVKVGDTVTWTNEDAAYHTVTGGAWDSGDLWHRGRTILGSSLRLEPTIIPVPIIRV